VDDLLTAASHGGEQHHHGGENREQFQCDFKLLVHACPAEYRNSGTLQDETNRAAVTENPGR
jgi:hypothetical protein